MPNTKKIGLYPLKRNSFMQLSSSAFTLLRRVIVLTCSGTVEAPYTSAQALEDLGFSKDKTSRAFKALEQAGFVTSRYDNTPYSKHTRIVSVNMAKVSSAEPNSAQPSQSSAESPTPSTVANTTIATPSQIDRAISQTDRGCIAVASQLHRNSIAVASQSDVHNPDSTVLSEASKNIENRDKRIELLSAGQADAVCVVRSLTDVRSGLCKFDYTEIMRERGLLPFIVEGKEYNPVFDFSELAREMGPGVVVNFETRTGNYGYRWERYGALYGMQFFLFSFLNEVLFFNEDKELFRNPEKCPCFDLNGIKDFFKHNQYGFFFWIMRARYGHEEVETADDYFEYTGELLIRSLLSKYDPSKVKGDSPLPFIRAAVVRQCLDIVASEKDCRQAAANFIWQARFNGRGQLWCQTNLRMFRYRKGPDYERSLSHYYPVYPRDRHSTPWWDLIWGVPYGCKPAVLPMRLTYPFWLMRKISGIDYIIDYTGGSTPEKHSDAIEYMRELNSDDNVKRSFEKFVELYGAEYPYLLKLAAMGFGNFAS